MSRPAMDILSDDERIDLLGQVPVGRIAVTVKALPVIFPINFAVIDDATIFRTSPGTKPADGHCRGRVRSGLLRGRRAHRLECHGPGGGLRGDRSGQSPEVHPASLDAWALDGAADRVVRIGLRGVSGRRFNV